jgi:hypothetical protein
VNSRISLSLQESPVARRAVVVWACPSIWTVLIQGEEQSYGIQLRSQTTPLFLVGSSQFLTCHKAKYSLLHALVSISDCCGLDVCFPSIHPRSPVWPLSFFFCSAKALVFADVVLRRELTSQKQVSAPRHPKNVMMMNEGHEHHGWGPRSYPVEGKGSGRLYVCRRAKKWAARGERVISCDAWVSRRRLIRCRGFVPRSRRGPQRDAIMGP